ncbi:HEPN domain-containing protein [Neptuniibacter caesariensis]|uniref:ApeA N-terminal domain-containing protein n=1 Tax=Neptuniibacter caesariensis TaxID=207954 RepID=A0A7U8GU29_NEPCE|nr:HEPN domain-containing protein [Neptuniibacter caesariensis]EAR62902.1 hypothetical protein MED92_07281 [Oceanospirillum sp. MED92] [Neptuniibacter caesariensis]
MRVKEKYQKTGFFWLPGKENKRIPGTLIINDGGVIDLEIVGLFDEGFKPLVRGDDIPKIIGQVEGDGYVTLERCFFKKKAYAFGGVARSLLRVRRAFVRASFEDVDEIYFDTVSFSVEGLDEWLGITGISVDFNENHTEATISYSPKDAITLSLNNGFLLSIVFAYNLPNLGSNTAAQITQKAYLRLSSEEPLELDEYLPIIHQITSLLCLAIDSAVSVQELKGTSPSILCNLQNETIPELLDIYYPSLPFEEREPSIDKFRMLFTYKDIEKNAQSIFNNWLMAYETIRPALSLYFSAVSGSHRYMDGRFLALAQGLETYHRRTNMDTLMEPDRFRSVLAYLLRLCPKEHRVWLISRLRYGNEISLGQRIKKIIEPYKEIIGNNKERTKLIRSIVDTRNYFTHFSEELESRASRGSELWSICQKMEAIFQLHLLEQLGFDNTQIKDLLSNNYKLEQKLG